MLLPHGRVIMISGANRGIGLATAQVLGSSGYRLSLGTRDPGSVDAGSMYGKTLVARWDATEPDSSRQWVAETASRFGQIDGIVMNAGISLGAGLADEYEAGLTRLQQMNPDAIQNLETCYQLSSH